MEACTSAADKVLKNADALCGEGKLEEEDYSEGGPCHNELVYKLAQRVKGCLAKVNDPNYKPKPECIRDFLDKLSVELVQISLRCPQKEAWSLCFLVNVHQRCQSKLQFRIDECPYARWARVKKAVIEELRAEAEERGAASEDGKLIASAQQLSIAGQQKA